jgi:tetratricopeptide (TPR) repeat protein
MRYHFFLFLSLCFIVQACSDGNHHGNDYKTSGQSFAEDTSQIERILRELGDDKKVGTDSLLKSLKVAGDLSIRSGYEKGTANVLFQLGNISYWKNSYVVALKNYSDAYKIAEKIGDSLLEAQCLERMGSVHLATDDPDLALNLYYKSLALSEKIGDSGLIAKVYNVVGIYKGQSGPYDTGVSYLNKAIAINKQLHEKGNTMENLGNLAYLYQTNGKPDEARKIYYSLIKDLLAADDKVNLPVIYFNMAALYQGLNQNDSAYYYLRTAIGIAKETRDTAILSTLYGNTGEIMLNEGKFDSAKIYLEKCIAYSIKIDDVETHLQALSFLIKIDTLTGKSKEVLSHYNLSSILQDSVYQRKLRHSKIASELQYENEKNKSLMKIQELTLHAAKKDRLLYIILFIISLIALGLISIVMVLQRRNHGKEKILHRRQMLLNEMEIDRFQKEEEINKLKIGKIEEDLNIKGRELTSIALGIEQKNNLLNLISAKLKESVDHREENFVDSTLNEIISSIKLQVNELENTDLFNQRLSMIHNDFFPNLRKIHPDLTKTELKFCAYLKVNLSGHQIAAILNVTNEAIRKTRYRIRKKMNLPPEVSLEDYISRF